MGRKKVSATTSTYLELLRAGLWNRPASISAPFNLKEMLYLAAKQSTTPLICKAVLDIPGAKISPAYEERMQQTIKTCRRSHESANSVIGIVCDELSKAGIRAVLLKGQGIASYYPTPEIRQAGDIDLYVGREKYDEACAILGKMFNGTTGESDKHAGFHVGGTLEIELHRFTETLSPAAADKYYQRISDKGTTTNLVTVSLGDDEVLTPEDNFNAFFIFNHLWEHTRSMGIGIRQLCDWAVFLKSHAGKLDAERLDAWLEYLDLLDVWQVFGCAATLALDLPEDCIPLYDSSKEKRGRRLVKFIINQGDNREFKHGRKEMGKLRHKLGSLGFIFTRFLRFSSIFPGKAFVQLCADIKGGIAKFFTIFVNPSKTRT